MVDLHVCGREREIERETHTCREREEREGGGESNKHLTVACFPERE